VEDVEEVAMAWERDRSLVRLLCAHPAIKALRVVVIEYVPADRRAKVHR